MAKNLKRVRLNEEEFMEEFPDVAMVAARELNGQGCPDNNCGDLTRKNKEYFSSGQLGRLDFNSAAVYYDRKIFSSVGNTLAL